MPLHYNFNTYRASDNSSSSSNSNSHLLSINFESLLENKQLVVNDDCIQYFVNDTSEVLTVFLPENPIDHTYFKIINDYYSSNNISVDFKNDRDGSFFPVLLLPGEKYELMFSLNVWRNV